MPTYALHYVDHGNNVFALEHFECGSDALALKEAERRDVLLVGNGYDLWDAGRLVFRHRRTSRPSPA